MTNPSATTQAGGGPSAPRSVLFVVLALACALPWPASSLAAWTLALGIVVGLLGLSVWPKHSKVASRWLIQGAIVALGLRIDIHQLLGAASDGFLLAVGTILGALALGWLLAKVLKVERDLGALISSGTAICGGSAIAAVGSSIRAKSSDMAIATAVVFLLNAVGVFALPVVGRWTGLDAHQFGAWAGVAIHDMASVNAVAKDYHGPVVEGAASSVALDTANVVKLTRVIWIAPIALIAAWWWGRRRKELSPATDKPEASGAWARFASIMPWFIVWFVAACALRTLLPGIGEAGPTIKIVSGSAFQLALFLIGAGVSREAMRQAGPRAMLHALLLWIALAGASLLVVRGTSW